MDIIAAKKAARQFVSDWTDRGDEKQDTQNYWNQLLRTVYGVEVPEQYIQYEKPVAKGFIDGYIADTKVLIEQKGLKIDLDVKEPRQGRMVTPYEQARDYVSQLAQQEKPDFIITCNFQTIRIYDCSVQPKYNRKTDTWYAPFEEIQLQELPEEYRRLGFLANVKDRNIKKEIEISIQAGELVGLIYDKLLSQYKDPDSEETQKSLNQLCVRLVFCLYAEDACVFSETSTTIFHDYLQEYRNDARTALIKLFRILDTETADRDPYENEDLLAFPYVNGGLFSSEEDIIIPRLTPEIIDLILEKASEGFDWSGISPTIFGAVFESTLNPETRRSGGMHYTSIENIHKVIDPLFLDDLKMEFEEIHNAGSEIKIRNAAKRFQNKLAGLRFLDPACGSGNFLTEIYLSLRKLENETLKLILGDQIVLRMDEIDPIKVKIDQFYGIEINDFAVSVAKTAMWIAEAQTMEQTKEILHQDMDFLPLKNNVNIHEGNALRMDWNDVVPASELNYIMGNPPFVGYSFQSRKQKEEILTLYTDSNGKPYKTAGKIDYVTGWYWKSCEMMHNSNIHAALVSTNSITQGEQVSSVWKPLYERFGIHINFAYRTFRWDSEASMKAHVHCVVIGFSILEKEDKKLFSENKMEYAENINPYLVNADTIFIEKRSKPICQVPTLLNGGKPTEGGFLILTEDEKDELLDHEPQSEPFVRPYMMGKDFIQRKPRYCLWMAGADPAVLKNCPNVLKRIEQVREYRLQSSKPATQKKAETPMLFDEVRECETDFVAIPKVSSEQRRYIPIEYLSKDVIPGDSIFMIPESSLYHFGVLTSNIHMAWMRTVAGRLKSDYRYSNTIVYNNFPWPSPSEVQKAKIEKTAQGILDARALYPSSSLADLYDPLTMPPELLKAHQNNDRVVMAAYGIKKSDPEYSSEPACVAMLMRMYQKLVEGEK